LWRFNLIMPQHKSAQKRVRQNEKRRLRNRIHRSRMRTMMKKLRSATDRDQAAPLLNDIKAYLDRLAAKGIIHRNKAANYKSEMEKRVNSLG
jgi:small subunit ribosomal protein S20